MPDPRPPELDMADHALRSEMRRSLPPNHRLALILIMSVLVSGAIWVAQVARDSDVAIAKERFRHQAQEIIRRLKEHMVAYEQVLSGGVALFDAAGPITREQWRRFVASQKVDAVFPGIQGIGFAQYIPSDRREEVERAIRAEGYPDFAVHPPGPRSEYSAIVYLEPFDWRNQRAFGYDMYSEPVRHAAMERARNSGRPAVSGRVHLVQETDTDIQPGFLMYQPLYRRDAARNTPEVRPDALLGWVYAPFRMNNLMGGVLPQGSGNLALRIYDGETPAEAALLYAGEPAASPEAGFLHQETIDFYGHRWTLQFASLPAFESSAVSARPTLVLILGLTFNLLLLMLLYGFWSGQKRLFRQQLLQRTSHLASQFYTLIEALPDAVLFKDGQGRWQVVNSAALRLFRLRGREWHGKTDHELAAASPDLAATFQACAEADQQAWAAMARVDTLEQVPSEDGLHSFEVTRVPLLEWDGGRRGLVVIGHDVTRRRILEESQARLGRSLRHLNEIAALSHRPMAEQMRAALRTGADHFGFEFAVLGRVEGDTCTLIHQLSPPGTLEDGQAFRLGQSCCACTLRADEVFAVDQMGDSEHSDHPCYRSIPRESYIGAPVRVHGVLYGTIHFSSSRPNPRPFDAQDREFMSLLARWAGSVIERERAEQALRESEEKFRSLFELSPLGMALLDLESGRFMEANQALLRSTGYGAGELYRLDCTSLVAPDYAAEEERQLAHLRSTGVCGPWETEYLRKDGSRMPVVLEAVRLGCGEGEMVWAIIQDITERKAAEREIHRLAFSDPLTGLANRRLLMDRLNKVRAAGQRSGRHGAVLYLDLDHFKSLNDTLGHDKGDLLLKDVAQRLNDLVRSEDTVARLGGDEFVVLLKGLSTDIKQAAVDAEAVGEKIREVLNLSYSLDGHAYYCTPSIGISLFRGESDSVEDLLQHADMALYRAKAAGRNTVCFFDPAMQDLLEARTRMDSDLHQALEQKQFILHYQLHVDEGGTARCAEVLLRWMHPAQGLILPSEFIPLAEENGLILELGHWVLEQACLQLQAWAREPGLRELCLSVNVSPKQFRHPDFLPQMQALIACTGARPQQLYLELSEGLLLHDAEESIAKMRALKALGFGLSLDDFGTGFSSLAWLTQLPFDQFKIDQSFIEALGRAPTNAAIVDTLIAMARTLGLELVAVGVETEQQRQLLISSGCTAYQGNLFSRPLPLDQFEQMMQQRLPPEPGSASA